MRCWVRAQWWGMCGGDKGGSDWLDSCIPFALHITQAIELVHYNHLNNVNENFQARNITDMISNS